MSASQGRRSLCGPQLHDRVCAPGSAGPASGHLLASFQECQERRQQLEDLLQKPHSHTWVCLGGMCVLCGVEG